MRKYQLLTYLKAASLLNYTLSKTCVTDATADPVKPSHLISLKSSVSRKRRLSKVGTSRLCIGHWRTFYLIYTLPADALPCHHSRQVISPNDRLASEDYTGESIVTSTRCCHRKSCIQPSSHGLSPVSLLSYKRLKAHFKREQRDKV